MGGPVERSDPVEPNDPVERRRGLSGGSGVHRRSIANGDEGEGVLLSLLLLGFLLWPCSSGFVQVDAKRLRLKLPDWLLSSECAIERPVQRSLTLGSSNSQRRTHARSSSLVMNNVGRWAAFGSLMELVLRPGLEGASALA